MKPTTRDMLGGGWAAIENKELHGSGAGQPAPREVEQYGTMNALDPFGKFELPGSSQDVPDAPLDKADIERAPKFTFYSQWANPPFPKEYGVDDVLWYIDTQPAQAAEYLRLAKESLKHQQGNPLQSFPGWLDGLLGVYDTAMRSIIIAAAMGASRKALAQRVEVMAPYLQAVPGLIAAAMTKAAEVGYAMGWRDGYLKGWQEGYDARAEETEDLWNWLKKLLATGGVAVGIFAAFLIALAAFSRR